MNIVTRRRLAAGAGVTVVAVAVGIVLAPPASAGSITRLSPAYGLNNNSSLTITLTTEDLMNPSSMVVFERAGAASTSQGGDTITGFTDNNTPSKNPTVTVDLTDEGSGYDDGPAKPGVYDVTIYNGPVDPFTQVVPPGATTDSCKACFNVFNAEPLALMSLSPNALSQGGAANTTFTGKGFNRGTRIEMLLPNGTVDTRIDPNVVPYDAYSDNQEGQQACAQDIPPQQAPCHIEIKTRTTSTSMIRRVEVAPDAITGARNVRLTNPDGATYVCQSCFSVNGSPLQAVTPNTVRNDPDNATARLTFYGSNLPAGAKPQLVFVGKTGSANRDLTIEGTDPTYTSGSVSADFHVGGAAPGSEAYQPQLVGADGGVNTCSCRLTVVQLQSPSVTNVDPNNGSQGQTRTVTVTGQGLSRGTVLSFGAGVTTTSVVYVDSAHATATLEISSSASPGKRDVTAMTTDGQSSSACVGCFSITQGSGASPTATSAPSAAGKYVALASPVRLFDSRGTTQPYRRGPTVLDLSSRVSATATAAVLNVTVVNGTNNGYVVVYPAGQARPATSNVNFRKATSTSAAQQANEVITGLSSDKRFVVDVQSGTTPPATVEVIVDVVGFFSPSDASGGSMRALTPQRAFDSGTTSQVKRSGETVVDLSARIGTATSVVLNVTVDGPTQPGYLVVHPTGTSPDTSNVNFDRGQTQANEVVTRVANGRVSLTFGGRTPPAGRLIVDLVGVVDPPAAGGSAYVGLDAPVRVLDTRPGSNVGGPAGRFRGERVVTMPPAVADARAVVLNVTATGASARGFVAAYPGGSSNPGTSNVNFRPGADQANEVIVGLGRDRTVTVFVGGGADPESHVIVDVTGYLTSGSQSGSPSSTPSASASGSASPSPTPTPSGTASPTGTPTPAGTASPTPTPTPSGTASPTRTPTPSGTASP
ncbi:MAG: hypothetical protein QOJ79_3504 [Actinomycetota bacterium]|nr:hypothetical protein [Actinomycetota bacterium]